MIWDLFKVYDVKRMFSQSTHDDLSLSRMPLDIAQTYVAEQLQMYGKRTLNVKLHMADIRVNVEREAVLPYTKLTAAWHPSTTAVEFKNGPHDGELMVMEPRLLFSRFFFTQLRNPLYAMKPDDDLYPTAVTIDHLAYDYAGWDEDARRWIYRLCK
jgi:hypothetical protein